MLALFPPTLWSFALASFTSFTLISADWSLEAAIGWGARERVWVSVETGRGPLTFQASAQDSNKIRSPWYSPCANGVAEAPERNSTDDDDSTHLKNDARESDDRKG